MRARARSNVPEFFFVVRYTFNEYFVFPRPISKLHPSMSKWLGFKYSHFDLKSALSHSGLDREDFGLVGEAVGEDFWFGREDVDLVWKDKWWFREDTGLGIWE